MAGIEQELSVAPEVAARVMLFVREARSWLISVKGEDWYEYVWSMDPVARPFDWDEPCEDFVAWGDRVVRIYAERAEALVALSFALPSLNLVIGADGGIVTTIWTTAEDGSRTQTSFAHIDRLKEIAASLRHNANVLVGGDVVMREDDGTPVYPSPFGGESGGLAGEGVAEIEMSGEGHAFAAI